jgi:hypothetical protein
LSNKISSGGSDQESMQKKAAPCQDGTVRGWVDYCSLYHSWFQMQLKCLFDDILVTFF